MTRTTDNPASSGQSMQTPGGSYLGNERTAFLVWAPKIERVEVEILDPEPQRTAMQRRERGYFEAILAGVKPGSLYRYILDRDKQRPDPASRFQPHGIHGPSQVTSLAEFPWTDAGWKGVPLEEYVIYELHVGTFTPDGTFDAVIAHLDEIEDLGITAIELMPVAQFPGKRNWGYDGVFSFAAQNSYGGPEGLARLVNACHEHSLAVVLDVVYNHLGPEGNVLEDFGSYFTDQYRTPWGKAVNFDGPESDEVVRFFTANALYWLREMHVDALRLDAIHGITDRNAQPFLQLLASSVEDFGRESGRHVYLIAESDLNDARFLNPRERGGCGLNAQWNDDFHHALHALLTGERAGYYEDFGRLADLSKAFREGYVYSGQYSRHRQCRHGNSSQAIPARQFIVFTQNHDQVGNRMRAERLSQLVSFDQLKLAATAVILSPFIPLLFMGEDWGEEAPFNFFSSYENHELVEAVRKGRKEEFAAFRWEGALPDPQDEATFRASKLQHELSTQGWHRTLREFYHELMRLRNQHRSLSVLSKEALEVITLEQERILVVRRWAGGEQVVLVFTFGSSSNSWRLPIPGGLWRRVLDASDSRWGGRGSRVPERIQSEGAVSLDVDAHNALVLMQGESR